MNLELCNRNDKVVMKNTYSFTILDKNGNEIDKKIYHNVCMPKRYFLNNVTGIELILGTMLPRDFLKYQENGKWKKDYVQKTAEPGRLPTKSEDTSISARDTATITVTNPVTGKPEKKVVDAGPTWSFRPNIKETDTGLFGTMVYRVRFDWECASIGPGGVQFHGQSVLDYHSPDSNLNQVESWSDSKDSALGAQGKKYDLTYDEEGNMTSVSESDSGKMIKGIKIGDGCLVSGGLCLSHFNSNGGGGLWKRPFEKVIVDVNLSFSGINCTSFGTPFIPQGNAMYGHSSNANAWSGLCLLRPTNFRFSGLPLKRIQSGGVSGCVPIMGNISMSLGAHVPTDKPEDWDDEEDGDWYGMPVYHYFGAGDPYRKTIKKVEKVEHGETKIEEVEVDYKNDKGQRVFSYATLKEARIGSLGNIGPVRTLVLDGCAADSIDKYIPAPTKVIRGFQIGVGDGVTTRFAHGITEEIGKIKSVYTDIVGQSGLQCISVDHYSKENNVFNRDFYCMYSGSQRITTKPNTYYEEYYDKKRRHVTFGLDPFTLNYYMGREGLLGVNEWLIYNNTGGLEIKSYWIGMNEGKSIYSDVSIVTADSENELYSQLGVLGLPTLRARASQHPDTVLSEPIRLKNYTALKGGNGWTTLGGYVGGFRYGFYDVSSIRICGSNKVPGFVEFNEPPRAGTKIYIDVQFKIPFFMNDMVTLSGKAYSTFGSDDFNGKPKK